MSGLSHGVIRLDAEEKLSVLAVQDVGQAMPGGEVAAGDGLVLRPGGSKGSGAREHWRASANVCVVKVEGIPYLCKTDEVGEICVNSSATATAYYGLLGITKNIFETVPVTAGGAPISDRPFTRTGLLGFIGPDNLVFVVGKLDGLMVVGVRRHNADDIVATALAVEPMKFVYRGRIAVFSVTVLHDDRIVLVAEQRPDASEEDSFQWMSRVLQAIDSIHQVGVYCLALVPANTLPKAPLGGIHVSETKQRFLEGMLHPCNVLMCPHTCVTNLPKPRQKQPEVGPASMIVGNLVAGRRIAQASGRELSHLEDSDQARKFLFLPDVLQWRAHSTPEHLLFLLLNAKGTVTSTTTCIQLHKKAERVAAALMEKARLTTGAHVALVYPPDDDLPRFFSSYLCGTWPPGHPHGTPPLPPPSVPRILSPEPHSVGLSVLGWIAGPKPSWLLTGTGVDLIAAFYGCLYCGCVPVTVRPPHPQNLTTTLPTVKMIVEVSKSACVLTTQAITRLLKSKEALAAVDVRAWPTILDTGSPSWVRAPTPQKMLVGPSVLACWVSHQGTPNQQHPAGSIGNSRRMATWVPAGKQRRVPPSPSRLVGRGACPCPPEEVRDRVVGGHLPDTSNRHGELVQGGWRGAQGWAREQMGTGESHHLTRSVPSPRLASPVCGQCCAHFTVLKERDEAPRALGAHP
ncbi:hypothetical protein J1605_003666 [Eschrichtius robustus]|uniref:Disco-interacting protein 2 A n=1 Tax=Eschrichtius robustus TaxID=9764 RepID=A0AB34HN58_ESCRO|nr:hypothetical protein J1605_003666 [Eschrichtius robustus]